MVTCAGVSEHEFYQVFENVENCYLAAFDEGLARLSQIIGDAVGCEERWLDRVRAGLLALLRFVDEEPGWARLVILQTSVAQTAVLKRRQDAMGVLAALLDETAPGGTAGTDGVEASTRLTADLVVGGVFSVIQNRMLNSDGDSLVGLAPSLMSFIVAPYLGELAAEVEPTRMSKGALDRRVRSGRVAVRATYRTSRVLGAISTTPRSSNREIADAAGLSDEGQTSKLLARLERQGLIENVGLGALYGEPNAWLLTPYGRRVVKAIGHGFTVSAAGQGSGRVRGSA